MANTTWNPSDLSGMTLSGGNLVVTGTATGGVRAIDGQSSGKYYFECTWNTIATNFINTGLALSTAPLTTQNTANVRVYRVNGDIVLNGTDSGISINSGNPLANNSLVCCAVDIGGQLVWFRLGAAGAWNGSGTANPATGTGGFSISALSGSLYPLMYGGNLDKVTANFGGGAFTGVVPSGFTAGWTTSAPPNYVDFSGNIGAVSLYGKALYGAALYSRGGAFIPALSAILDLVGQVVLAGNLTPSVTFGASLSVDHFLAGNLAPVVTFSGGILLNEVLAGNLAPQIALGGSLSLVVSFTALEGGLTPNIVLRASNLISGPLWAETEPCPPSLWTPTGPCDPVDWQETELCNG